MSRLLAFTCSALLLAIQSGPTKHFHDHAAVEAYEIRPGFLVMPRYSAAGEVCEIGLERLHYTPNKIYLQTTLSREMVDEIFDEVFPRNERGKKDDIEVSMEDGGTMSSRINFERAAITIYSSTRTSSNEHKVEPLAATIEWKNRECTKG